MRKDCLIIYAVSAISPFKETQSFNSPPPPEFPITFLISNFILVYMITQNHARIKYINTHAKSYIKVPRWALWIRYPTRKSSSLSSPVSCMTFIVFKLLI